MRRPTMDGVMSGPLGNIVGGASPASRAPVVPMMPPTSANGGVAFMVMRGNQPHTTMSRPEFTEELEVNIEQKRTRGNLGGIDEVTTNEVEEENIEEGTADDDDDDNDENMAF